MTAGVAAGTGDDKNDNDDNSSSGEEEYSDEYSDEESSSSEEESKRRPSYALVQLKSTEHGKAIKEGLDVASSSATSPRHDESSDASSQPKALSSHVKLKEQATIGGGGESSTSVVEKNKYHTKDVSASTTTTTTTKSSSSSSTKKEVAAAVSKQPSHAKTPQYSAKRRLKPMTAVGSKHNNNKNNKSGNFFSSFMSIFFSNPQQDGNDDSREEEEPLFAKVQLRPTQQGKILKEGRDILASKQQQQQQQQQSEKEKIAFAQVQLRKSPSGPFKKEHHFQLPDEFHKVQLQPAPSTNKDEYSSNNNNHRLPQAFQEVKLKSSAIRWGKRFEVGTSEYQRKRERQAEQAAIRYHQQNQQQQQQRNKGRTKSKWYRCCHALCLLVALCALATSSEHYYYNHRYGQQREVSDLFVFQLLEPIICQAYTEYESSLFLPSYIPLEKILVQTCQVLPKLTKIVHPIKPTLQEEVFDTTVLETTTTSHTTDETPKIESSDVAKPIKGKEDDPPQRRRWIGRFMMMSKNSQN